MKEIDLEAMATREMQKQYEEAAKKDPELPAAVIWASLAVSAMVLALELKMQLRQVSGNPTLLMN